MRRDGMGKRGHGICDGTDWMSEWVTSGGIMCVWAVGGILFFGLWLFATFGLECVSECCASFEATSCPCVSNPSLPPHWPPDFAAQQNQKPKNKEAMICQGSFQVMTRMSPRYGALVCFALPPVFQKPSLCVHRETQGCRMQGYETLHYQ